MFLARQEYGNGRLEGLWRGWQLLPGAKMGAVRHIVGCAVNICWRIEHRFRGYAWARYRSIPGRTDQMESVLRMILMDDGIEFGDKVKSVAKPNLSLANSGKRPR